MAIFPGTPSPDVIAGTPDQDVITGRGGNDLLFGFGGRDRIFGDADNDDLFGGDGPDELFGGIGNDDLFGQGQVDLLTGNAGADTFHFEATSDSGVGVGNRDIIVLNTGDATGGFQDIIDLLFIDANTLIAGNQTFSFIGDTGGGVPARGQVGFFEGTNSFGLPCTVVAGNNDSDPESDFEIQLGTILNLDAGDFIL
jgi:serralysin